MYYEDYEEMHRAVQKLKMLKPERLRLGRLVQPSSPQCIYAATLGGTVVRRIFAGFESARLIILDAEWQLPVMIPVPDLISVLSIPKLSFDGYVFHDVVVNWHDDKFAYCECKAWGFDPEFQRRVVDGTYRN